MKQINQINKIYQGDAREVLKKLPDESVHCIVTSPPYYGLRDYGMDCQIGLEDTPEQYIEKMVEVFSECKRILKKDGTLWLNIGDSYAGSSKGRNADGIYNVVPGKQLTNEGTKTGRINRSYLKNIKPKDLIGIPWMLAFALRADGWYLRQDIIWHKPNPMPESVTDRCTKSHEYIFLLSKSAKYYYDFQSIMQPVALSTPARISQNIAEQIGSCRVPGKTNGNMKASWNGSSFDLGKTGQMKHTKGGRKSGNKKRVSGNERGCPENNNSNVCSSVPWEGLKANKRSVWSVTTKPFSEAHFATFPEELIIDPIKAGCIEKGIVLDPFLGAGTTALVASKLNRNFIGIELNPAYIKIAEDRMEK